MFSLANQVYNFFHTVPLYRRARRKKSVYFETLQNMRMLFIQNKVYHRSIDNLTSLIYAYSRHTQLLKQFSDDMTRQAVVDRSLRRLEQKIIVCISRCNDALSNSLRRPARRHSFHV